MNNFSKYLKKYRFVLLLLVYALLWVVCRSTLEYTVTFEPNGGELLGGELIQVVKIGKDAVPPELDNGRYELHWDVSSENIREDTLITAQWVKVPLDEAELAEYLAPRTVRVLVADETGAEHISAGFFLDGSGRVVTAFGPVAEADHVTVVLEDGSRHEVVGAADYDRHRDLIVLETGLKDTPYLEFADACAAGDTLFGWNKGKTALLSVEPETFDRNFGIMNGVETGDMRTLPGEVLVDICGDVVALRHSLAVHPELSVDAAQIRELSLDKDKTWEQFRGWYNTERSRSYEVKDGSGYRPAMVRTYQMIVGADCEYSILGRAQYEGYYLRFDGYLYEYFEPEFGVYLNYLEENGYTFTGEETENGEKILRYQSELDRVEVQLRIREEKSELEIRLAVLSDAE